MGSDTRHKLNEAGYFLEQMQETYYHRYHFKYNLSAFLSAARSVTFCMQKEYNDQPGFKRWYEEKQKRMMKDQIFPFMNAQRVKTNHQYFVHPRENVQIDAGWVTVGTDSATGEVIVRHRLTPDGEETVGIGELEIKPIVHLKWYFNEPLNGYLPSDDVMAVCKEYFRKIEKLAGC